MQDLRTRVAGWIRIGRNNRGMTQEELAERVSLSVQSISAIENARNLPGLDTMLALTEVLGLDVAEILGKSTRPQPRLTIEAKARNLLERLDDETLGLAIRQLEVLVDHSERLAKKRTKKSS